LNQANEPATAAAAATTSISPLMRHQIMAKAATVQRLLLLKSIVPKPIVPKAMTTTTDTATTDASTPALLESETSQEQPSPMIRASGVAYPDRDPTVPLVWLVPPGKEKTLPITANTRSLCCPDYGLLVGTDYPGPFPRLDACTVDYNTSCNDFLFVQGPRRPLKSLCPTCC
jgi:hypothetical protein